MRTSYAIIFCCAGPRCCTDTTPLLLSSAAADAIAAAAAAPAPTVLCLVNTPTPPPLPLAVFLLFFSVNRVGFRRRWRRKAGDGGRDQA